MNIQKILVPVDFSAYSKKALEYALGWGDKYGADIFLLYVNTLFAENFDYETSAMKYLKISEEQEKQLQQWMEEYTSQNRKKTFGFKVIGGSSAANSILEFIARHDFDLVIMGTRGRTGTKHFLLGSVAEKVARLSPVPVLITHSEEKKSCNIKNVLVPIDFSEHSKPMLDDAVKIAKEFQANITLLYVVEYPNLEALKWLDAETQLSFKLDQAKIDTVVERMKSYLNKKVQKTITCKVSEANHAYEKIIEYAEEDNSDLIMMASRGIHQFKYFLSFGSTTERVIRLAFCPVMVFKQHISEETAKV